MRAWLGRLRAVLASMLADSVDIAGPFMVTGAALGAVAFPLFYLIWTRVFPQPYENLPLRLLGSALCVAVLLRERWPTRLARWFPLFWQFTVFYGLAFLLPFLALQNGLNEVWVLSTIAATFLLTFFVEWRSAIGLFVAGAALAWGVHAAVTPEPVSQWDHLQHLVIFAFPLTFGSIVNHKLFSYRRLQSEFEKRLRHITIENARRMQEQNQLLSRFLNNTIVTRLRQSQRQHGLSRALDMITQQERRFCGIMQADVRNFTKMFGHDSEMEVARLIHRCFSEITEIGQDLAVIKPIGDCIFVYSDSEHSRRTAAVNVIALAVFFVNAVQRVNRMLAARGHTPLNFGVSVHAGEAIYGNLASETLIDPTVIGINVNLTARMEELTKVPAVQALTGTNAVILSPEAVEYASAFFGRDLLVPVPLDELNVRVRDFPDLKLVYALSSEAAEAHFDLALEHIEAHRPRAPAPSARPELDEQGELPFYYELQGMGPDASWIVFIDVGGLPARSVQQYAAQHLADLAWRIDHANGQWLIVSTEAYAGEMDEVDLELRARRIVDDLGEWARLASS